MPSYASRSLPRSPRLPSLSLLTLSVPSPTLSHSKPAPPLPSTESPPPPPPNHVTTFLSILFNLPRRSPPASHQPFHSLYPSLMKSLSLSSRPDLPPLLSSFLHQPHLLHSSLPSLFPFFHLPLSPEASTILLTSLCNLSDSPKSVDSVFRSIKHPDAVAYGALIAVLCRAGCTEEALEVLDQMRERGVRPTARTCTCILKAYCVQGRVREAQNFLWFLENGTRGKNGTGNGILPRPDVIMYTAYIEGLCLVHDFDSVTKVMASWYGTSNLSAPIMRSNPNTPLNRATNCFSITLHCVLKQAEEETSTWKPNSVTYNVYISGLCRAGMLSEAFHQVAIMHKKGSQPTIETLNVLFDCLCRDPSTIYKAKELLDRSGELDWEVDSYFYNTLMSRLLEMGEPVGLLKPLTDMVKKGIKPDICSFTISARVLCKAGKFRLAMFIITTLEIEVDVTAYNTLLHELYKAGELQEQKLLYILMRERNVHPSKFTYEIMVDCLCKEGNFVKATDYVIGLFGERLFGTDLVSHLNKWLVACGRFRDIVHLLDKLSKRGHILSPPLFDSVIKAFCWKGYCKGEDFYKISLILDYMLGKMG